MKRNPFVVLIIVLSFMLIFSSCTSFPRVSSDDPFTNQLDDLYQKRVSDQTKLTFFFVGFLVSSVSGTVISTMHGNGSISDSTAQTGLIAAYSLGAICGGGVVWSYFDYSKDMNDYLETLRLQSQYNNLLLQQK